MTFKKALKQLKEERVLYSDMLKPLNISFEFFLRMGQLTPGGRDKVITKLIEHLDKKVA
tara:strand:+ start:452 stop:628 length:177 start_codon:yes stop_codon:yes gene_type:complete